MASSTFLGGITLFKPAKLGLRSSRPLAVPTTNATTAVFPSSREALWNRMAERSAALTPLNALLPEPIIADGAVRVPTGHAKQSIIFAIFDADDRPQFVGFTRDLRASLLRILIRKPAQAVSYAASALPATDPASLQEAQTAWFNAIGGPPPGNRLSESWSDPIVVGTSAAAIERAVYIQLQLQRRGFLETLEFDVNLLAAGLLDIAVAGVVPRVLEAAAPRDAEVLCLPGVDLISANSSGCVRLA